MTAGGNPSPDWYVRSIQQPSHPSSLHRGRRAQNKPATFPGACSASSTQPETSPQNGGTRNNSRPLLARHRSSAWPQCRNSIHSGAIPPVRWQNQPLPDGLMHHAATVPEDKILLAAQSLIYMTQQFTFRHRRGVGFSWQRRKQQRRKPQRRSRLRRPPRRRRSSRRP